MNRHVHVQQHGPGAVRGELRSWDSFSALAVTDLCTDSGCGRGNAELRVTMGGVPGSLRAFSRGDHNDCAVVAFWCLTTRPSREGNHRQFAGHSACTGIREETLLSCRRDFTRGARM